MSQVLLEMRGITKTFPGVKALDNVQLTLKQGRVMALMGENGAGKSTLMKVMFGIYQRDSGTIRYKGEAVEFSGAKEALESGISMIIRNFLLFYIAVLQRTSGWDANRLRGR